MLAIILILLTVIILFLGIRSLVRGRAKDLRGRIERIFHDELVRRAREKEVSE
jgi:hypothetical protein